MATAANRDFKPRARPAGSKGSGLLVGMFIGFLLGLGVAAAIAVYVFRSPPFTPKTAPAKPGDKAPDASTLGKAGKNDNGKPRFDFYRILPGQEEPVTDKQLKDAAKEATKDASKDTAKQPIATGQPDAPAPEVPRDLYFIQAAAFQNPADADNLKAKLALLGLEANVEPTNVPEKGVWYRVRLGPFSRIDEINRVRSSLAQNGIDASLVRIRDAAAPR